MANILVNGLQLQTGGGKTILWNYLNQLKHSFLNDNYFILTPDYAFYKNFCFSKIKILDIPCIYKKNIFFPILYLFELPSLLRKYKIDVIFNFGDIIIPSRIPQLYHFDWPYACYPDNDLWHNMSISDSIVRKIKLNVFKWTLGYASIVIVQTQTIKQRLHKYYDVENIVIIPNPVYMKKTSNFEFINVKINENLFKFLYLTYYYTHKNIEILIPVAKLIKNENLNCCLITTLDENQHPNVKKFFHSIKKYDLEDIIINIGEIELQYISSLYKKCDALLMPTLLESYGLPYIEAMYHERPILTSDLDFARDVCGDAALYFDPMDPISIINVIKNTIQNNTLIQKKVENGKRKLASLPNCEETFIKYQDLLLELVKNEQKKNGKY